MNRSPGIRGFFNFNDQSAVSWLKASLPASCRIPIFPNFHFPLDSIFTNTTLPAYSLPVLDLGLIRILDVDSIQICSFHLELPDYWKGVQARFPKACRIWFVGLPQTTAQWPGRGYLRWWIHATTEGVYLEDRGMKYTRASAAWWPSTIVSMSIRLTTKEMVDRQTTNLQREPSS